MIKIKPITGKLVKIVLAIYEVHGFEMFVEDLNCFAYYFDHRADPDSLNNIIEWTVENAKDKSQIMMYDDGAWVIYFPYSEHELSELLIEEYAEIVHNRNK